MEKGSNDAPERLTVSALNFLSSPLPPLYRSRTPPSFFLISKLQEDELQRMENDPSNKRFTSLSMMPFDNEEHLTYMYAGWAGQFREYGVTPSVLRKVLTFLQTRPAVLHADELINKKDQLQVRFLMYQMIKHKMPVQVAFFQGMLPLQHDDLFPRLLDVLTICPVWSVNLGELRFSEEQCAR